jgi:hypothetical protein
MENTMKDVLSLNEAYGEHFAKLQEAQRDGVTLNQQDIEFITYYATELLCRLLETKECSEIMTGLKNTWR